MAFRTEQELEFDANWSIKRILTSFHFKVLLITNGGSDDFGSNECIVHSRVLVLIHNLHAHAKEIKVKGQGRLDGNGKDSDVLMRYGKSPAFDF